uniref:DUF4057 domain-containing protein n=1 Tax=Oryza meridionalis TaxID=40149 RepID=A0A0E0DWY0_9ORYZ
MERPAPVRKSHTSTADLLTWPEAEAQELAAGAKPPPNRRPHQPSEAISKVVFGGQVTEEEFESLNKRKPCSAPLWKEMTGSGIFAAEGEVEEDESSNASATPIRTYTATRVAVSVPPDRRRSEPVVAKPIPSATDRRYKNLRLPLLASAATPRWGDAAARSASVTDSAVWALRSRVLLDTSQHPAAALAPVSSALSSSSAPYRLAVSRQAGSFSDVLRHCGRCYLKLSKACISTHGIELTSVGTVYKSIEVQ